MIIVNNTYKYKDAGLLLLRIGIGCMFILHGFPKIMGGEQVWIKLGQTLQQFGIYQYPEVWGYLAAFAELGGGVLLIFGMLHRLVCFTLFVTMLVAISKHLAGGDSIIGASHAIEAAILFCSLLFIGPGKISIDNKIFRNDN